MGLINSPQYGDWGPWTMPLEEWQTAVDEMEVALPVAAAVCPHCGAMNLFPGFSQMLAFICRECGQASEPAVK